MNRFVIGLDFGTDSVRALLVNALTGKELDATVEHYPRWKQGLYCDPLQAQFRQHPLDYVEAMEASIGALVARARPEVVSNIVGIGVDTTGSTPVAVDREGTPLSLLPAFASNPNAMFVLWKDHTAIAEAEEINRLSHQWETDFTQYSGGIYSSEWFWSKILHILRIDESVRQKAYSWVEHCDWIPALLTGNNNPDDLKRSRCAAGHKAMWHDSFNGLPSESFLTTLDPLLTGLRDRLYEKTFTSDEAVGTLSPEWASRLGLSEQVVVAVGSIDAHMGAVGAAIEPYSMVKVVGTSTCDMLVAPLEKHGAQLVGGICGQVDGSIIPGMLGMEAGQSAFGDFYHWFASLLTFPVSLFQNNQEKTIDQHVVTGKILTALNAQAATLPVSEDDEIILDWINGRRTPDAQPDLRGWITGLRLGTDAPRLFKALVESTAFGSRAIIERFETEGIPVNSVSATGGISKKSPFVMQTLANVLNRPIRIVSSEQTCALGSAMCAAVAGGVYGDIAEAQGKMASGYDGEYVPQKEKVNVYNSLYQRYQKLGRLQEDNML